MGLDDLKPSPQPEVRPAWPCGAEQDQRRRKRHLAQTAPTNANLQSQPLRMSLVTTGGTIVVLQAAFEPGRCGKFLQSVWSGRLDPGHLKDDALVSMRKVRPVAQNRFRRANVRVAHARW